MSRTNSSDTTQGFELATFRLVEHCLNQLRHPFLPRLFVCLFFGFLALEPSGGSGLLVPRGFLITHNDAPQSVGLLWTSDQFVAETST
jgi:hypothetical protein